MLPVPNAMLLLLELLELNIFACKVYELSDRVPAVNVYVPVVVMLEPRFTVPDVCVMPAEFVIVELAFQVPPLIVISPEVSAVPCVNVPLGMVIVFVVVSGPDKVKVALVNVDMG